MKRIVHGLVHSCARLMVLRHFQKVRRRRLSASTEFPLPSTGRGIKGEGWEGSDCSTLERVATNQSSLLFCLPGLLLTIGAVFAFALGASAFAQSADPDAEYVRSHFAKFEYQIPMRDGVKLFTAVYIPYDRTQKYPILLFRTPYSCRPYGADKYPGGIGPNIQFAKEGYIFANQDVRGRY